MTHARDVATEENADETSPQMRFFIGLVMELCRELGGDPERVLMGESLQIAEMEFRITYLEPIAPEWVVLSCNVMDVQPERELDICLNALEWNNGLYDGHAPVLALDAERTHIVSLVRLAVDRIEAKSLYRMLEDMAAMIPEWAQMLLAVREVGMSSSLPSGHPFDEQWRPWSAKVRS